MKTEIPSAKQLTEWRQLAKNTDMVSAVGEYTPIEFTVLLDAVDAMQARVTALEAALAWAESTAVNLYCALQSTAHMDPNDRRIPTITGQVVLDLIVVRDRAREALSPAQPEGEVRK